jgi:hypothetical protein
MDLMYTNAKQLVIQTSMTQIESTQEKRTFSEEIVYQLFNEGVVKITISEDTEGWNTAVLYSEKMNQIVIVQEIEDENKVLFLDEKETNILKTIIE